MTALPDDVQRADRDAVARRFAFLAEVGEALASSLDHEHTLKQVARLAIPVLGDLCIVDEVDDGEVRRVAFAHVTPQKAAILEELRVLRPPTLDSPQPAARVLRSGQPELLAIVDADVVASHTVDQEHAALIRRLDIRSHIAVPLVARGSILGVISVGITESDRRYDESDVAFVMDLARRAALAIDNARLYRSAQREIAERRRVEEALRFSERRFRAVVEQSPLSTQILAPTGFTIGVNGAWEKLWGVPMTAIAAYNMLADPQLEKHGVASIIRRAFAGEAVEIPAIHYDPVETIPDGGWPADSGRWVRAFAYPIKDDDGSLREVVLVHEDVSDRMRNEERLRAEDRRKDEFLAMLAHELRNPLAPLRTGLDVLAASPAGAASEKTLAIMQRQLSHLVRLVDDLLELSRVTRGIIELDAERTEVQAVVAGAVEMTAAALEHARVALSVNLPSEPLVLRGDPARLTQVVTNLLTNAVRFTPAGGHVVLDAAQQDGSIVIRVKDDGVGIVPAMLEHVFEMFAQVDRSHRSSQGGLGIGLTLARRLVELHGGKIWAESEGEGRGSTFVVALPRDASDAQPRPEVAPEPVAARLVRRVLVVDDNTDAAEMLVAMLELEGHEVRNAGSGPEALDTVRDFRPDVAVLDIGMPGMTGHELAGRLRALPELAGVFLIAVTGWGQEEDRRRSREAGFDRHLTKPVQIAELTALIASVP